MNIPRPSGAIPGERYSRMHTLSATATVLLSLYHRHSLAQDAQVKFANKAAIRDDGLAKLRRYSSLYLSLCCGPRLVAIATAAHDRSDHHLHRRLWPQRAIGFSVCCRSSRNAYPRTLATNAVFVCARLAFFVQRMLVCMCASVRRTVNTIVLVYIGNYAARKSEHNIVLSTFCYCVAHTHTY